MIPGAESLVHTACCFHIDPELFKRDLSRYVSELRPSEKRGK